MVVFTSEWQTQFLHATNLFKPITPFQVYNSTIRQEEFLKVIYIFQQ